MENIQFRVILQSYFRPPKIAALVKKMLLPVVCCFVTEVS